MVKDGLEHLGEALVVVEGGREGRREMRIGKALYAGSDRIGDTTSKD